MWLIGEIVSAERASGYLSRWSLDSLPRLMVPLSSDLCVWISQHAFYYSICGLFRAAAAAAVVD